MSWIPPSQQPHNNAQVNAKRPLTSFRNYFNNNAGSNFQNTSKPTNLNNAAVRQLLRENGIAGKKEVIWPPPPDDYEIIDEYRQNGHYEPVPHHTLMIKKEKKPFEPPPQYISLQEKAPLVQNSSPVYRAEPVAESFQGGSRSTGNEKWPPVRHENQVESNKPYMDLTRSPQFRPRKPTKDYSAFFAKNALPSSYAGYKAPPGTQHYWE